MNYKKESQFTNNASKRVFEEVYTNEDMTESRIYSDSYKLNVPQMFSNNPSQEKAISPRRVECEPKPHKFSIRVVYINEDGYGSYSDTMDYIFTQHNNIDEILNVIVDNSKTSYIKEEDEEEDIQNVAQSFLLKYDYEKTTGDLIFYAIDTIKNFKNIFRFSFALADYQ